MTIANFCDCDLIQFDISVRRKSEGGRRAPLGGNSSEASRAASRSVSSVERNQQITCALLAFVGARRSIGRQRFSAKSDTNDRRENYLPARRRACGSLLIALGFEVHDGERGEAQIQRIGAVVPWDWLGLHAA